MNQLAFSRFLLFCGLILALCGAKAQSPPAADFIITHANIWTVDPAKPSAQAVAILRDRIVAVGTDAEVSAWRGP